MLFLSIDVSFLPLTQTRHEGVPGPPADMPDASKQELFLLRDSRMVALREAIYALGGHFHGRLHYHLCQTAWQWACGAQGIEVGSCPGLTLSATASIQPTAFGNEYHVDEV